MSALERFGLGGRVALVTGASRGLGLAMARVLGEAGAQLAITARRPEELEAARTQLEGAGHRVMAIAHDQSRVETAPAMIDSVLGRLGRIDILVNNAGATWGAPAEDHPREAWDKVMRLNLDGSWAVTQAVARSGMIERRSGVIVFISSIAGLAGNRPEFVQTVAYNTSKAGIINLARTLAGEWGRYGIRVNCIAPGFIPSKMSEGALSRMRARYLERVPLGRLGCEDDLAGALLFLASDASSYVSGQVLAVDGGFDRRLVNAVANDPLADAPSDRTPALRHPFDADRLTRYLETALPSFQGPLRISQFEGGQSNPTYLLHTPAYRYVMRRKPPGNLLPSAHAVDREFRVMQALGASEVPVPRMWLHCKDAQVVGTEFFVMEHLDGRLFWDPALPGLQRTERAALYDEMNRVIAAVHRVDVAALGLADFGRPGNYIERQIERWSRQYRACETQSIDEMEHLMQWLPQHVPAGDETSLVHGDFRIDNLIFHPTEARVLGVLDWELSTLGHPLVDFAYHAMLWRVPGATFRGLAEADLPALGIPAEDAYVQRYCGRSGRTRIDHWEFYLAFNLFRIAAILQGVLWRALQGNAASAHALQEGQRVRPLAQIGWAQARQSGS